MRRADLMPDWQQHTMRTVLSAILVILVLGVALGAVLGLMLTRAFDAAGIDEFARNFSGPHAADESTPR
jgi:ABC-type transporter Mla maintaining outer membrane lipid asymmetry permease subunit MlaE